MYTPMETSRRAYRTADRRGVRSRYRHLKNCRCLDGLTYSEIAAQLQVSPSTVKNYISSALVHCYHTLHGADPLS